MALGQCGGLSGAPNACPAGASGRGLVGRRGLGRCDQGTPGVAPAEAGGHTGLLPEPPAVDLRPPELRKEGI